MNGLEKRGGKNSGAIFDWLFYNHSSAAMGSALLSHCHRIASGLLVGLALVGCSKSDMLHRFASPEDEAVARSYIDQLRHHRFDGIKAAMDQSLAGPSLEETLAKMAGLFPSGDPTSVKLVGVNAFHGTGTSKINLTAASRFDLVALLRRATDQRRLR